MKTALTIAGSDSYSGAGIQQDLKTFNSFGIYGTSVITAITAQNTKGIHSTDILPLYIISGQIDSIFDDIRIDAVKTGMLCNKEIIRLVMKKMKFYNAKNLVVDPVMKSTTGYTLLERNSIKELKKLISISKLATPNIYEAEILSGIKIKNIDDLKKAAKRIGNCVITGGHADATDILHYKKKLYYFKGTKRNVNLHGLGCAFSAAIAANLAKGLNVVDSVKDAKNFINEAIDRNFPIGSGLGIADTSGLMLSKTVYDKEKTRVLENVENAVRIFISNKNSYKLIPQVGINIAMALPNAKSLEEVAGITGRVVRDREGVFPVGVIDFNASKHVGRVVLTAMKFDKGKRAAMNIRSSEEILNACKKLKLKISNFERDKQPKDTNTMEWGTRAAIKKLGKIPNIIYDNGGKGKEAMIRIIGRDAREIVKTSLNIAKFIE